MDLPVHIGGFVRSKDQKRLCSQLAVVDLEIAQTGMVLPADQTVVVFVDLTGMIRLFLIKILQQGKIDIVLFPVKGRKHTQGVQTFQFNIHLGIFFRKPGD